jgi:two-component system phosphate regulon response regulator PhoB
MDPYVLIVEDEESLATLLSYNLQKEGFRVAVAKDGEEALVLAGEEAPDLVLLDWMLPKVSGIEVCRRLRQRAETQNVPIIMLTARGEETDRVRGLDTGADDYIAKPFSMTELFARIRAVLRRIRPGLADDQIKVGEVLLDRASHRVRRSERDVRLGPTEFRLLEHLMQHPGRVFSRSPHRGRPRRPFEKITQRPGRDRPDPHRALGGLLVRRRDGGARGGVGGRPPPPGQGGDTVSGSG